MSEDYVPPLKESLFLLDKVLGWQHLFELPAFAHVDKEVAEAVLREGAKFCEEVIAPINRTGDAEGSQLKEGKVITPNCFREAYTQFVESGWAGLDMPEEYGGQGLPLSVQLAFAEMLNGACISFSMLPIMLRAASWLLIEHGPEELVEKTVPRLVSGEWGATICISEAQAGSDVGRIRTRAVLQEDGSYRLTGSKIFISYGDHDLTSQIVHMVLARVPDAPQGTAGLSLFVVPKLRFDSEENNHVSVSRVEKKMGLKASPTCVLNFDDSIGYRIGEEHQGLRCMFTMVNLMRLEVSIQGPAVAGAANYKALRYASQRPQGGRPDQKAVNIIEHADVRRMLLTMRSRTDAMRALVYEAAFNLDLARAAETEEERNKARYIAEFLLPVCKACGSETGFDVANLAIQVFGGHGYVADAGVEQHVRDVRVAGIYEGSNGIQALDLVFRKLIKDSGRRYGLLKKRIEDDLRANQQSAALREIHLAVDSGLQILSDCTRYLLDGGCGKRNVEAGATHYLQLTGLVAGGWMVFRSAAAVANDAGQSEKLVYANYYALDLVARANVLQENIKAGGRLLGVLDNETLCGW